MTYKLFAAAAVLAFAVSPVSAQSNIYTPKWPAVSTHNPVFMGMLVAPGSNSCRRVYKPRYGWECSYGQLPPGVARSGLGGAYVGEKPKALR